MSEENCSKEACASCAQAGNCSKKQQDADQKLHERLSHIKRMIVVMSGKGGVGKSTVATNLAVAASLTGKRVGLLDVDLHGPSIPTMLGLENESLVGDEDGIRPVSIGSLLVLSVGFILQNPDDPVIWRGPMKMGVIRQFLEEVNWGDLDLLVIDAPPGTGDEPLTVCQLIPDLDGAVIVTTPQKVAAVDVRKSVSFCRELNLPVLGVVENMSGFVCPHCGQVVDIMSRGGGQKLAESMGVPFLGAVPIDPAITASGDSGRAFVESTDVTPAAQAFRDILAKLNF